MKIGVTARYEGANMDKELEEIFDVPFVFWLCPDHRRHGRVEWNEECTEATCLECGKKSTDAKSTTKEP